MAHVTIIGAGNMGSALTALISAGGNSVQLLVRDTAKIADLASTATPGVIGDAITGDIVILALPYGAVASVVETYADQLNGKVVVDLTNPLDFATFDSLVVPADSSAAQQIALQLPGASILKAFNTNFAATLQSGVVGAEKTTVLVAGDSAEAKSQLEAVLSGAGLKIVDAGSLKRARELEALGFLQLTLAAAEKTSWTSGFALAN